MHSPIKTLVKDFGWIHSGLGVFGNLTFVVGSVFFLPAFEVWQTLGVWLFIVGSSFMLIGALGELLVKIYDALERKAEDRRDTAAEPAREAL